jgi:hypothetical protein
MTSWDLFLERSWRQRHGLLDSPSTPFEAGEAVRAASAALWGPPARYSPFGRVYIDSRRIPLPLGLQPPVDVPTSVRELLDQVRDVAGTGEVSIVLNDLQIGSPALLEGGRRFISGLVDRVGLPVDRLGIDLFAGDYRRLPFGLHVDPSDNFLFGIDGVRRIRLGRDEDDAVDVRPGEVLYWPADTWHIGECPDGPSLALTISWWAQESPLDDALRALTGRWRQRLATTSHQAPISHPPCSEEELPESLIEAARSISGLAQDEAVGRSALLEAWAGKRSSLGFHPLPLTRTDPCAHSQVRRRCVAPIEAILDEGGLIVAANGYTTRLPTSSVAWIQRLNRGELVTASEMPPDLLDHLWRWRALE